jgi:hypothetical protein
MNPNAPTPVLSLLIDRDGTPIEGIGGEPLAADEQGIVYTLRDDGLPEILGGLAGDDDGRLILIPMNGLGATADVKDARIQAAKCRRAMARGRRKMWQRKIQHLSKRIARGQANGSLTPRERARLEQDLQNATTHLERAKAREAAAETALTDASNLSLSGDGDDMAGLAGRKRFGKKFLKRAALMAFTGGAAAPFLAASRTRAGNRAFGRFLNDDGSDPMMAGDEMPVSTQVAGMGDIGSWWTKNREKVLGFGAGAASAALVASGASKGTGLNTLVNKGWDAAKGFFIPPDQAAPAGAVATPSTATPMMMPAPRSTDPTMRFAPASIGGMDAKTLLLLGGLGLGVLVLFRPKK